jgi:hypothetical protein
MACCFCLLISGKQLLQGLEKGEVSKKTKAENKQQSTNYITNGCAGPHAAIKI